MVEGEDGVGIGGATEGATGEVHMDIAHTVRVAGEWALHMPLSAYAHACCRGRGRGF